MRLIYALFVVSLVSIISADIFLSTPRVPAKLQHVAPPSAEPPKQVEIKAATPEDPGPIGTVVSPLKTLSGTQSNTQAQAGSQEPAAVSAETGTDHVEGTALPVPEHFLHRQFTVTDRSDFVFTVPAQVVNPHLRGNFRAFTKATAQAITSEPADVDVMLMNERQFQEFVLGRSADAAFELDASSSRTLNYAIPATLGRAQRYHLVFLGSRRAGATVVDADFTVTFQ